MPAEALGCGHDRCRTPRGLNHAGAGRPVHTGRVDLVNVGHRAIALREIADAVHRRDVAVHRIESLEHNQLRPLGSLGRQEPGGLLGARGPGILFTSGGTESNNCAILGAVAAAPGEIKHVITSAIEHSAVLDPCKVLADRRVLVRIVRQGTRGRIEIDFVSEQELIRIYDQLTEK